jgi:uncharacterized protein (DUF1499 family)
MKTLMVLAALLVLGLMALAAYVRLAPSEPARWHVDPTVAPRPGKAGWLVRPTGGDAAWPVFAQPPTKALAALHEIALATPRTRLLAGSPQEGRITYVTRSRLWGFPDFTTVQVLPAEGGATFAALARLRFGQSDTGVNRARLDAWQAALRARLGTR